MHGTKDISGMINTEITSFKMFCKAVEYVNITDSYQADSRSLKDNVNFSPLLHYNGFFQLKFELFQTQGYSVVSELSLLE